MSADYHDGPRRRADLRDKSDAPAEYSQTGTNEFVHRETGLRVAVEPYARERGGLDGTGTEDRGWRAFAYGDGCSGRITEWDLGDRLTTVDAAVRWMHAHRDGVLEKADK